MQTSLFRVAFLAALAVVGLGCSQQNASAPTTPAAVAAATSSPEGTINAAVKALRANNVGALFEITLPPPELVKMKADWSKEMNKDPVTDEDRKQFAETIAKLTAPDAEGKLYAQIEPQLKDFDAKSAQQMPMMVAMGRGFAQSAIQQSKDLTDAQKQQAQQLLDAVGNWAQTTKFTDPALVKSAIAAICKTARDLNLKTIDEARALTYDQGMQKAGIILGGVKQVLLVYGLNTDKSLDSVKIEPAVVAGDSAKVKISYVAFDQPFNTDSDLVKVDNKWYSKQAIEQWTKRQQEQAVATTPPPPPPPAPAAK
ncbi:MAG: hypothetical protein ABJB01_12080 [Rudaea sp.]